MKWFKKAVIFTLLCNYYFASGQVATDWNFNWLIGQWEAKTKSGKFYETWKKSSDHCALEAMGGELSKSDTVFTEQLCLIKISNYWVYVAVVGKQPPVLFTLMAQTDNKFIFENEEHDFPKRIIYEYIDSLNFKARVEGKVKGKPESEEYVMKKVK